MFFCFFLRSICWGVRFAAPPRFQATFNQRVGVASVSSFFSSVSSRLPQLLPQSIMRLRGTTRTHSTKKKHINRAGVFGPFRFFVASFFFSYEGTFSPSAAFLPAFFWVFKRNAQKTKKKTDPKNPHGG